MKEKSRCADALLTFYWHWFHHHKKNTKNNNYKNGNYNKQQTTRKGTTKWVVSVVECTMSCHRKNEAKTRLTWMQPRLSFWKAIYIYVQATNTFKMVLPEVFCSMPHWLSLNAILCILYLVMHKEWIAHLDEIHDSQILILPPMFHPNSVEIQGSISKYWRNSVFCTFLRLPAKAIQQLQSCCIIAVSQKYPCDIPLCSLT